MKTKCLIFCMAIGYALVNLAMSGCTSKGGAQKPRSAGDTLVLNVKEFTGWNDTLPGGYWQGTYNDNITSIPVGEFVFSHLPAGPGSSWGGSYWDGFTTGTNGDNHNYGAPIDSAGSADWVGHQWGCMAGGAVDAACCCHVQKGDPYLLAYWGYFMEPEYYETVHSPGTPPPAPMHDLTVHLDDYSLFNPLGVLICNHPWPYYGNVYGDGFAHPMNKDSDYFKLLIHGLDADSTEVGDPVVHDLAQGTIRGPVQSSCWQWVDLTDLGENLKWLYFTLETSDADPQWGPNTAVYFCLDKLKVVKTGASSQSAATEKAAVPPVRRQAKAPAETDIVYPREFKDYLTVNTPHGGPAAICNTEGKEVLQTTLKPGRNRINTSALPSGRYLFRHGHRVIHLSK